jgi:hypothetical protein
MSARITNRDWIAFHDRFCLEMKYQEKEAGVELAKSLVEEARTREQKKAANRKLDQAKADLARVGAELRALL